ncbi:hypothetical protein LTR09_005070 [Extremus antarcticus]|uniref:Uncharacterized protein n=1 Tax=Extremus antarcticus TaxID=702011 RepID=A0AAJ0DNV6_9PEZI|nr:hypothetical protein LTR09_005070 [Extremus antarcticus]
MEGVKPSLASEKNRFLEESSTTSSRTKKAPTYKGYKLDSALSKPIVDIVIDRWTALFVSQGDAISEGIIKSLVADEVKLKRFLTRISEVALSSVSVKVRNKIIDQNRRPDRR